MPTQEGLSTEQEDNPYRKKYKTGSVSRATKRPMSIEQQEIVGYIRKKIRESQVKRLGPKAIRAINSGRFLRSHDRRLFLANLVANAPESEEGSLAEGVVDETFRAFGATGFDPEIPQSYAEAMSDRYRVNFEPAIQSELESIRSKGTFGRSRRRPKGHKPLGLKWVFDIKRKMDGSVERYKARLVAKGFTQVYGESYTETFASTPSREAIRLVLSLAASFNLPTFQGDVKTAFLNGVMEEEVYCKIPEGWPDKTDPEDVLPLLKTLYGTKQASRQWQKQLRSALESLGFSRMEADPCVFMKRTGGDKWIMIVTYVDDIFGTSNDRSLISAFEEEISKIFEYSSLGPIHKLLGNWVVRTSDGGFLVSSEPAIKELCKTWGIFPGQFTAPRTPGAEGVKLSPAGPGEDILNTDQITDYQALIGSLLFLSVSCRGDISQMVHELGRFVQKPTAAHWAAAIRVLKYLSGTMDYGLYYEGGRNSMGSTTAIKLQLTVYSDASWANSSDRKSTSGMIIQLAYNGSQPFGHTLSYYSRRQGCVALSSTEAEYIALSTATQTVSWIRRLLSQLGFLDEDVPTCVFEDNQAAISIGEQEGLSQRTKHIDVRHHYIRDKITDGTVYLEFIPTVDMLADFFTKSLDGSRFEYLRGQFMARASH